MSRALAPAVLTAFALAACGPQLPATSAPPSALTVLAAASLKPPFDKIGDQLRIKQNVTVTFSYAGSQTLVGQLIQGAQADVFASADDQHMSQAANAGLLQGSARVFAHNELEIAVARGNPKGIHTLADLARPKLVVVLADPTVPAGNYARQVLARAGVTVRPASLEQSVSSVLAKVALGEADAGIVYSSDIQTSGQVDGVAIPDSQNIVADYPIAILKSASNVAGANAFVAFVLSTDGVTILKADGFEAP